jgi:hypothetical protein
MGFLSWIGIPIVGVVFTELDKQLLMLFIAFIYFNILISIDPANQLSNHLSETSGQINNFPKYCVRHLSC